MTPQLQQAIKLLELSNQDLVAYVEEELERNPLLERADDQENAGSPELPSAAETGEPEAMLDTKEFGDREALPAAFPVVRVATGFYRFVFPPEPVPTVQDLRP